MLDAIPVLSSVECELARQAVHALRSSWITRGSADYPFYTVGAASYIDAVPGTTPPRYSQILVETNPVLREHFDWLYARVMNKLSVHLQAVVRTADELALPGFHVWQGLSVPTSSLSIHFDLQYLSVPWPDVARSDHSRPLSFTLPIALPRGGGGLNTWDLSYEEQAAHLQATASSRPSRRSRSPGRGRFTLTRRACSCSIPATRCTRSRRSSRHIPTTSGSRCRATVSTATARGRFTGEDVTDDLARFAPWRSRPGAG